MLLSIITPFVIGAVTPDVPGCSERQEGRMETSNRQSYTKEQRAAAVADVPALGVNEAAKKHGVPQTCVSRWVAAAGVRREWAPALASARKPKAKTVHTPKAKATHRPKAKTARKAT